MQDWSSINAQPDQANIFAVVSSFLKSAKGRKKADQQQQHKKKKNRPGAIMRPIVVKLSAKTFQYICQL
jgi:hypothetical protein